MNKFLSYFFSLMILTGLMSCDEKEITPPAEVDNFNGYISGYSAGPISRCGDIYVQLAFIPDSAHMSQVKWYEVLQLKPQTEIASWYDPTTNRVKITEPGLEYNQKYRARLNLGALTEVPEELEFFDFDVETKVQSWNFQASHPEIKSMEDVEYKGWVTYADCEPDRTVIDKGFTAKQGTRVLPVSWQHPEKESKKSYFTIKDIKRTDKQEVIEITLSMDVIGEEESATHELIIPSKADFSFMKHTIPDNDHIALYFSDPLDPKQNLEGLIELDGRRIIRSTINFNRIDLYLESNKYGYFDLEVRQGIKNIGGFPFKDAFTKTVFFAPPKPFVRFAEKGHILPPENSWRVPVEMVSASGFRLRILKVFEHKVHQYFQENIQSLNTQRELEKVGRLVLDTVYDIKSEDLFNQSIHMIDLGRQVRREPRALYKLFLTIPTEHNAYPCDNAEILARQDRVDRMNFDKPEGNVWYDDYSGEYYYDYYGYSEEFYDNPSESHQYTSNPCTDYYFNEIKDQRLLICTDVGLVVKKEPEKQRYFTYVSRISTAEPLAGAEVTLYDYQGNELTTNYSNSHGFAFLNTGDVPFLIKAKASDGQAVYMHMLEEKALSLSTFQVEGKNWGSGSKLFFYGDRNVWRPGDSSFIHCVYFNENDRLPARFPLQVKLKDPRGRTMKDWNVSDHTLGLFDLRFSTDINDPTGLWKLEVAMGNEVHTHPIRIETIRPNRLKFNMNFANQDLISSTDPKNADVEVKWMHGLEAGGLNTEINMQQKALQNPFGSFFNNFVFDDISKSYLTDLGIVKTADTEENGIVSFEIPTEEDHYYPSQMRFSFRLRSFEKGGAFSTDVKSVKYSPYTKYAGVKWPGSMTHNRFTMQSGKNMQLICVDEGGKKVEGNLTITVYDIKSSWWYQYGRNGMDYSAIKNQYKTKPVVSKVKVGKEGKPYTLKGHGTKHVVIQCNESGHTVSRDIYLHDPNYWDDGGEEAEQVEVLPFLIEDTEYTAGEILRFDLPPATGGKYMITVENGGSILHDEMHHASSSPTSVAIRIEENMSPTAYVHVHYIAAYNSHNSHRPLRLFGIQPIKVYAPETILEPEIQMAEELRTDRSFDISIKEKSGKRMAYTIAIVDEGLLDITQFKTPDAWSYFFAKEALSVKTWDMYRDIFHRFLGEYTSLLAVGGDEAKTISPEAKARRFKPAVKFIGPFTLEAGQEATHTEIIKEYVGSVRAMVMATNGKAFGKTEKTAKVIKPLMLYSTLPRVLRPGERVKLPVTIFAMKDHIKNVDVQVKCLNAEVFKEGDTQNLTFDKIGEKDISFWMDTPDEIGVLQFEVTAKSGNETTSEKIEIDLNPSSPPITTTVNKMAKAGESIDFTFDPIGIKGTNQASINLSRGLNFSFEPFVDRLSRYPHGCVEQSVSSVFPQIYLSKMGLLNNPQQMSFRQRYKAVIQKLRFLQLPNGGFSYWPGGNKANTWGTTYALQFLLEAKRMGYDVPKNMLKDAINYQYDAAGRWAIPSTNSSRDMGRQDLDQAYRLYSLVLADKPNYGAMNRLRLVPNLNSTSKFMLSHAMTLVGEEAAASVLLKNTTHQVEKYREFGNTFGSNIRDQALILRVLMERGDKILAKRVIDELTPYFTGEDNRYLTTQEMAQCMVGFSLFVDDLENVDKAVPVAVSRANEVLLNTELKEEAQSLLLELNDKLENKINIKNNGEAEIFSSLILSGTPLRDESSAEQNDLELKVKYLDNNGTVVDFKNLQLGQDYTISVSLNHPGVRMDYENMALTVMVPPGCEFINTRLMTDIRFNEGSSYDYQDMRDDRVYTYFTLPKGGTKEFRFLVNATYEGKYWTPSVFAEAMYDPQIRSKTEGFWTLVGR